MISLCWMQVNVLIDADYDELNTYLSLCNFTVHIQRINQHLSKSEYIECDIFLGATCHPNTFFYPVLIYYIVPLHKKWSTFLTVPFLGIGVILTSLLILYMADRAFGQNILDLFIGGSGDLSQYSLWAMLCTSIVFLLIIISILRMLLLLSRYTIIFTPAQHLLLWISRWLGKIYRFLVSGCPAPVIRLTDVAIVIWLIEKAYNNILMASISRTVIEGTSQINGHISNVTYLGAGYTQGSLLEGPFDGLLLNMDSTKGVILFWNYLGDNFFVCV